MDAIPDCLEGCTHWQYGVGLHSSDPRKILGSVLIPAYTDIGREIHMRHVVLDGSSQWFIGRNVTRKADLQHISRHAIRFVVRGKEEYITLIEHERLSYISLDSFRTIYKLVCSNANIILEKPWKDIKNLLDKVQKHVCGHANLTDIQLLLKRNNLWNSAIDKYISKTVSECTSFRSTTPRVPNRKVSISSLSKGCNDLVCIDHLLLGENKLVHCMDSVSRYSTSSIVDSTNI